MSTTLAALAEMTDAQERGYAFERHVAELMRREQFEVDTRTRRANGRQVDLFATRGDRHFLIETKWRKARVGTPEVDELLRRLERGAPNIVGVLISWSGFAKSALDRVEQDSTRPVLLISGAELSHLESFGTLHGLLVAKHQRLIIHRQASVDDNVLASTNVDAPAVESRGKQSHGKQSRGKYAFLTENGHRLSMMELPGSFGPVTFCLDLPDLDWGDGRGVAVEIALDVWNLAGLTRVFHRLADRGWVTPAGTWRIHQQGATWNGFGLDALLDALHDPDTRYAGRLMHHSETLMYVDTAGGGLYTLTAQVGRTRIDQVTTVMLSFRLPGIPLDPGPLHTLVRGLDVDVAPYFRPLDGPVTERVHLPRYVRDRRLRAEAVLVGSPPIRVGGGAGSGVGGSRESGGEDSAGTGGDAEDEWVVGAVVKNPFRGTDASALGLLPFQTSPLDELGSDNDLLICALGAHHFASERRDYVIDFVHTTQIDGRLLTRIHLDWFDEAAAERRGRRPTVFGRLRDRVDEALTTSTRLRKRWGADRVRVVRVDHLDR